MRAAKPNPQRDAQRADRKTDVDSLRGRRIEDPADQLSALRICVRLDHGRAAVVAEIARHCGIENPEMVRRMIDYWIEGHSPAPIARRPA